ncbi:hypothetical protein GNI_154690, partial [Gregarina niphandrodes]
MRTLKSEASGVLGSELLSVLIRPDGSQTKLDDCVAQLVTIRTGDGGGGGGEVTALVLAPKKAFRVGLGSASEQVPLTTMVEGDWFEQWDRMMVWRPKEGPPSDQRSEAALLAALRRRLARSGPRNKPEAVEALCREVFGEHLQELHAILEGSGEMQRRDDLTVAMTRPIDPSELTEVLTRVPRDWMTVLEKSAGWKTADWKTEGWNDGGDMEGAPAKPRRETKRRLYTTAGVLGLGAVVGFLADYLLRSPESAQRQETSWGENLMGASEEWKLQLHRHPVTWAIPPPLSTCGSGVLY